MPSRTRCPRCETVLNVPVGAEGRKLKCPHCSATFRLGDPGASARSSMPGMDTARPASSSSVPEIRRPPPRDEEPDLPVISGDLRDAFDLPLLREDDDRPAPGPGPPKSGPWSSGPSSGGVPAIPGGRSPYAEADAAGLVEDDEPIRTRRLGAAEARATSRRCSCGSVVPAGMSLCQRCGLDLETGVRDTTFDLIEVAAPPPRTPAAPFGVMVVGVTSALVGGGVAVAALVLSLMQSEAPLRWGFLLLAAVGALGFYGAVRLLQGRSPRLLMIALLLGGLVDVGGLLILPIAVASSVPLAAPGGEAIGDAPAGVPRIIPLTERIDWQRINLGLAILALTAVLAIYLNAYQARRHADRR